MRTDRLVRWLLGHLPPPGERTRAREAAAVAAVLRSERPGISPDDPDEVMSEVIVAAASELTRKLAGSRRAFDEFSGRYFHAESAAARRRVAAAYLGATVRGRPLWADRRALRRHLDHEALRERAQRQAHDLGRQLEVCLTILAGRLAAGRAAEAAVPLLLQLLDHRDDAVPRVAAMAALREAAEEGVPVLAGEPVSQVTAPARDPGQPVDLQLEALGLLLALDLEAGTQVLRERLMQRSPGRDDFLVRAAAVRLAAVHLPPERALDLLDPVRDDPSEHVRMTLARTTGGLDGDRVAPLLGDPSPRVRAAAIIARADGAVRALGAGDQAAAHRALEMLRSALADEPAPLTQRIALEEADRCVRALASRTDDDWSRGWVTALVGGLASAARGEEYGPPGAYRAARLLAGLRPLLDDRHAAVIEAARSSLQDLEPGARRKIRLPDPAMDPVVLGEGLAALGDEGFGFSAQAGRRSARVQYGERSRRSLARIVHELRHRSPYKRQAGAHTTLPGRSGTLRVPPANMAAITTTGVPGEPVVSPGLGSWGPHLPTVVDCLDAARTGRPLRIVHAHGTTMVRPPPWPRRIATTWSLRWNLGRLDVIRQRSLDARDTEERSAFVTALEKLGFSIELDPGEIRYDGQRFDLRHPTLEQFFRAGPLGAAALAGLPPLGGLADQAWRYIYSGTGNSLLQLAAFIGGLGAVVMGDALVQAARIRRWRRTIPLVIGGSGTRGKSGSERLKAALFHALGNEVLCKTTGNEAMVIHSAPGIEPQEMLLYRPYDRASIWEQRDVLKLGAEMGVQVLLWECMALNPRYIEILSLEWMRDDLTTVTNCYPDHEDVQGPSGRDVAAALGRFVPRAGKLLTTEREMTPILQHQARSRGTECRVVDDREADLLPLDLLGRFPYREHPRNIALVASLAEELGIDRETAIIKMADHLVPDIGALKVFPTATFRGRRITYVNGHSANERTGFLNNWERTGLARFDPRHRRGEWVAGVINNRGDRVARSRAFAGIVAGDVSAHALCLIGTNLGGFVGYLRRALEQYVEPFRLSADTALGQERFERLMARLHMGGWTPEDLNDEISAWFVGCGLSTERTHARLVQSGFAEAAGRFVTSLRFGSGRERVRSTTDALARDAALVRSIDQLCDGVTGDDRDTELRPFVSRQVAITAAVAAAGRAVQEAGDSRRLARRIGRLFVDLIDERTHRLRDARATGDQVLDFVISRTPPGVHLHAMGMQNIKGTGLDFVYRWISLEKVTEVLERLGRADPDQAVRQLRWLRGHPDYGVLDSRLAASAVHRLAEERFEGEVQQEARVVAEHLRSNAQARARELAAGRRRLSPAGLLVRWIENSLDYLHSIHRRRAASRVFDDLVHQRISHARAAALLRELASVQKGGWLSRRLGL